MNARRKRVYSEKSKEEQEKTITRKKYKAIKGGSVRVSRPLGTSRKVIHRYVEENVDLNPGLAGIPAEYFFSANGLYDPNITGVGHQPVAFDEMVNFFDHYTVIYSQINVWANNIDTGISQFFGVKIDDDTTAAGSITRFVENGNCKWKQLGVTAAGNSSALISMETNVSKFMGRPSIMSEDDLRGDSAANPNDQCYWHLMAAPNVAQDSNIVRCLVEITYVAVWTEPRDLNLS